MGALPGPGPPPGRAVVHPRPRRAARPAQVRRRHDHGRAGSRGPEALRLDRAPGAAGRAGGHGPRAVLRAERRRGRAVPDRPGERLHQRRPGQGDIHAGRDPGAEPARQPAALAAGWPRAGRNSRALQLAGVEDTGMRRISVVGNSGSGKTTMATRLAAALGIPHLELDSVFHQADWQPLPREEFRAAVRDFAAADAWVIDGNYDSAVRDLV